MSDFDELEQSELDLTSEPLPLKSPTAQPPRRPQLNYPRQSRIRLHFNCCKVLANFSPPDHVLQGKADVWRVHCPRCGRLTEILFE